VVHHQSCIPVVVVSNRLAIDLTIYPDTPQAQTLIMKKKIEGQERGLLWNDSPVATLNLPSVLSSEYHIHVAQGMDMALFVAAAYCHLDKQGEGVEEVTGGVVDTIVSVVSAAA
jgi:hypothetical protein